MKALFEILFTAGLCLIAFIMFDRHFAWLPDFSSGLLGGVGLTLALGAGSLKHMIKD